MPNNLKRRLSLAMGALIAISSFFSASLTVCATDYAAQEEEQRLFPIESNSYEEWPNGPIVNAAGAILVEAKTGTILYAKNIHEKYYPASVTKLLTCVIGVEQCKLDEMVEVSREAVFSVPSDGSNIGLDAGEAISVEQCLYAILVGSANEAANALAEHISGSIEAFAALMNERAKELGCADSHFVTTNGLHDDEHYTSAYDLSLIARVFFDNPLLCKMSSTATYYIPKSATQPDDDLYVNTHNKFLYSGSKYNYEYLVGSKTGYTGDSRQTLVTCAEKDGMKLICVILRAESPHQYEDTIALFDYGFDNFKMMNVAANEDAYTVENQEIFGDLEPILSINPEDSVVLPVSASFEDLASELNLVEDSDTQVANISYTYHGKEVGLARVELNTVINSSERFDFNKQPDISGEGESVQVREDLSGDEGGSGGDLGDGGSDSSSGDSGILRSFLSAIAKKTADGNDSSASGNKVIFINVRKLVICVAGLAGILIFILVVKSIIGNYQFSKRRNEKSGRKRSKKRKKMKRGSSFSPFDGYDF